MRRRSAPWLIVIGAFLLLVVPSSVTYYTDWMWFHELGYEGIFLDSEGCTIVMFGRPDPDARAAEVRLDHLRPYPYV